MTRPKLRTKIRSCWFLMVLASLMADASQLVQGTIRFENRNYSATGWLGTSNSPVRYATVEILNTSGNVLASTFTNGTGSFSVTVQSLNAGDAYKLRVLAETAAAKVGDSGFTTWTCTSTSTTLTSVTFTITRSGSCPNANRALNMMDAIVEGYQYADGQAASLPSQVEVIYPGTGPRGCSPCYDQILNNIYISTDAYAENDDALLHEYGHFLMDDYTFYLDLPYGDHYFCAAASTPALAFSEGWANYIIGAVRNRSWWMYDPGQVWIDLETGETHDIITCKFPGIDEENAVAAVLWDTKDSANESFDTLNSQEGKTWSIVDDNWHWNLDFPDLLDFRVEWGSNFQMDPLLCQYAASFCPPAPTVTTQPASNPGQTTATLNGLVNPNGAATTAYFDYGTTTAYGSTVTYGSVGSGTASVPVSSNISSLLCGTTYHFRVRASNVGGSRTGSDQVFSTASCPPSAPSVTTQPASNPGQTTATLNGLVNPNGAATTVYFDYGITTAYGATVTYGSAGSGTANVPVSSNVSSLLCGTTYHFQARASNTGGSRTGGDQVFSTAACPPGAPSVTTQPASNPGQTTATLNALVNPNGAATTVYFDYGTSTAYGSTVTYGSAGSGTANVSVSSNVSSLLCGTTYHFQARASSAGGSHTGGDQAFSTAACTSSAIFSDGFETGDLSRWSVSSSAIANWHLDEGSGSTAFDSVGAHHGTVVSAAWTQPCVSGNCLAFNGPGSYVSVPDSPEFDAMRTLKLTFRLRLNSTASGGVVPLFRRGSLNFILVEFFNEDFGNTAVRRRIGFTLKNGNFAASVSSQGHQLTAGQWYTVQVQYDGGQMKIYIDGVLSGQYGPGSSLLPLDVDDPLVFGKFSGSLDEIELSN